MRAALVLALLLLAACGDGALPRSDGGVSPADAGCPPTWAEARSYCEGAAAPCPRVDRCTYAGAGDCPSSTQPCSDAVAECQSRADGGTAWSCAQ